MTAIYFRVDGNSDIATGHIMRCLTIARACAQVGKRQGRYVPVSFLVSDPQSRPLLENRFEIPEEFAIHTLNSDYRNMTSEVPSLLSHITHKESRAQDLRENTVSEKPWLFVDSYFVSPDYFALLPPYCRIAYLDDLRSFDCPVDLIVNYDTDQDCPHYTRAAHKLLGMRYTPLRTQFRSVNYLVRPKIEHVLLSTGGTDPYGVAENLLHIIFGCENCPNLYSSDNPSHDTETFRPESHTIEILSALHYHIVTSRANTRYDSLLSLEKENSHIHIHENVTDMASLMASCDLAVSAGGTTLSELCAVGVPTISYLMADNQRTAVENFAAKDIIPCAGDIRPFHSFDVRDVHSTQAFDRKDYHSTQAPCVKISPAPQASAGRNDGGSEIFLSAPVVSNILHFMTHMSCSIEARQKSSHAMRAFLDGRGAERIADALLSL